MNDIYDPVLEAIDCILEAVENNPDWEPQQLTDNSFLLIHDDLGGEFNFTIAADGSVTCDADVMRKQLTLPLPLAERARKLFQAWSESLNEQIEWANNVVITIQPTTKQTIKRILDGPIDLKNGGERPARGSDVINKCRHGLTNYDALLRQAGTKWDTPTDVYLLLKERANKAVCEMLRGLGFEQIDFDWLDISEPDPFDDDD